MLSTVAGMIFISLVLGGFLFAFAKYGIDNTIASIIIAVVTITSVAFWVIVGKCYYDIPRKITINNTSGEIVSTYENTHILDFDENEVLFVDENGAIQRVSFQTGMIQYEREG